MPIEDQASSGNSLPRDRRIGPCESRVRSVRQTALRYGPNSRSAKASSRATSISSGLILRCTMVRFSESPSLTAATASSALPISRL
jgi:hypothetical protein